MEKGKFVKQEEEKIEFIVDPKLEEKLNKEEKGDLSIEQMQELYRTLDVNVLDKISEVRHSLGFKTIEEIVENWSQGKANRKAGKLGTINKLLEEVKVCLPELLENKTNQEVLDFLYKMSEARPKVMEDIEIKGVYCDMEGTLFNRGELNNDTLQKLKNFEKGGKKIILWTDGNIKELQLLLDKEGIKYPLKRKIDYAGAHAEIVIDNDDDEDFQTRTGIHPKTFIKV